VATPDQDELASELRELRIELARIWTKRRRSLQSELIQFQAALALASPQARVDSARQRVDELLFRATTATRHALALRKSMVDGLMQTLSAVGPETVLARGYAVVRQADDGALVRSIAQVRKGDKLDVRVSDGSFGAHVEGQDP
jgi:exodeoxyribonuclease VII large subunit